jgi:cytochrome c oxidase subunit 2
MLVLKRLVAFIIMGVTGLSAGVALAATIGQPEPWQLGLQKGATPVMDDIIWFHDLLLWLITAIALFVLALLVIVVVKFNARANPTPSRTTHNTTIEVLWTGAHPGDNRNPIVPPAVLPAQHAEGGRDGEGDR